MTSTLNWRLFDILPNTRIFYIDIDIDNLCDPNNYKNKPSWWLLKKKQQSTNTDTDQCWGGYLILLITIGFGNLNISEPENHHFWCVFMFLL
jgi:hypothetical protein